MRAHELTLVDVRRSNTTGYSLGAVDGDKRIHSVGCSPTDTELLASESIPRPCDVRVVEVQAPTPRRTIVAHLHDSVNQHPLASALITRITNKLAETTTPAPSTVAIGTGVIGLVLFGTNPYGADGRGGARRARPRQPVLPLRGPRYELREVRRWFR